MLAAPLPSTVMSLRDMILMSNFRKLRAWSGRVPSMRWPMSCGVGSLYPKGSYRYSTSGSSIAGRSNRRSRPPSNHDRCKVCTPPNGLNAFQLPGLDSVKVCPFQIRFAPAPPACYTANSSRAASRSYFSCHSCVESKWKSSAGYSDSQIQMK